MLPVVQCLETAFPYIFQQEGKSNLHYYIMARCRNSTFTLITNFECSLKIVQNSKSFAQIFVSKEMK